MVEQRLCANSLDAIVANVAADALQPQAPRLGVFVRPFRLRLRAI